MNMVQLNITAQKYNHELQKKMIRKSPKKTRSYSTHRKECDTIHLNLSVKIVCVSSVIESVKEIVDGYAD